MSMVSHGGMISTGELLIDPLELSCNPTSSHLVANQKDVKEIINLALRSIFVRT
jgi:hypothetical protein